LDVHDILSAFSADSSRQLDVLGHDGHALGVDCAQVGVLEKANQISLGCFLKSSDGGRLKAKIRLEILGDLADQPLEGQLADQKLRRFLVSSDLSESNRAGAITMRLLHAPSRWGTLPGSLGCQLLTGSLASGRLSGGLLSTGHLLLLEGV